MMNWSPDRYVQVDNIDDYPFQDAEQEGRQVDGQVDNVAACHRQGN